MPNGGVVGPNNPASKSVSVTSLTSIRYIRWYGNGSGANASTHFCELKALTAGGTNRALNLGSNGAVSQYTGSSPEQTMNNSVWQLVTNEDISSSSYFGFASGGAGIQFDLGAVYTDLSEIRFWNYYADGRTYNSVTISVSADNSTWTTLYGPTNTASNSSGIPTTVPSSTITSSVTTGLWRLEEVCDSVKSSTWPMPFSIISSGLILNLDAGKPSSYPGSGTTWTDLSGNGYHGTLLNGPTYSALGGGSILFDGVDDYVSGTLPTTAVSNVTLQGWVNIQPSRKGPFFRFGSNNVGYSIGQGTSSYGSTGQEVIMLFYGIRWISTGSTWDTGWQMVTMVLDSSGVPSAYKNGTLIGSYSGANSGAPSGSYELARVIGDEPGGGGPWNGNASTFWAYNRALSSTEITQNYNTTRARFGV